MTRAERIAHAWLNQFQAASPPARAHMVRHLVGPIRAGIELATGPIFEKRYDEDAWSDALAETVRELGGVRWLHQLAANNPHLAEKVGDKLGSRAKRVVLRTLQKLEGPADGT